MSNLLEGMIEMHVHSAPDIRGRKMNDLEIMEAAVANRMRAVVIKSHCTSTADRATLINWFCREKYGDDTGFEMFGGITLNHWVGGINPYAVDACLRVGGRVVWLPTLQAANHWATEGKSGGVSCVDGNRVIPEMQEVFRLVCEHDAVLGFGHMSTREMFVVAEAARAAGVKKLVVNHPEHNVIDMSLEDEKRMVKDYDVLLEGVYAQPIGGGQYKKNFERNLETIREVGAEHFVVATDAGQKQNDFWHNELAEYAKWLLDHGVTQAQLDRMTKQNPAWLLGIDQ